MALAAASALRIQPRFRSGPDYYLVSVSEIESRRGDRDVARNRDHGGGSQRDGTQSAENHHEKEGSGAGESRGREEVKILCACVLMYVCLCV